MKTLDSNLVTHVELKKIFGKREYNGFKPMPNEYLIVVKCDVLLKLYKSMYVHIPMIMASILQFFSKVGWPIAMATK
jgi:hypothetical protein